MVHPHRIFFLLVFLSLCVPLNVSDAVIITKGLVSRNSISYPDISIPYGKATFITGESGTGKTTLLRLFNQTETQMSGTISFNGSDVSGLDAVGLRTDVMLCGQTVFLFSGTIRENFNEYRRFRRSDPLSDEEMRRYLSICCAEYDIDRMCGSMSGGERARVFLAIHLSFTPAVLMLDEPTSSLDADTALAVMLNIKSYCTENGMTLISVSHDRNIVDAAADTIIDLGGRKNE